MFSLACFIFFLAFITCSLLHVHSFVCASFTFSLTTFNPLLTYPSTHHMSITIGSFSIPRYLPVIGLGAVCVSRAFADACGFHTVDNVCEEELCFTIRGQMDFIDVSLPIQDKQYEGL
ncbi:hypothetical protein BDN70DRAFT_873851 [Pholiota conissans]|uniref:Uncharacterized protein n=1 Tax=Pholiota conissans TaxID=109636 RepID=A0A9P6D4I4_9AGAR|nr:hypothetical protein BDN70DRAFT_873851 [Pholiota conissans]